MVTLAVAFLTALAVSLALTLGVRRAAHTWGLLDQARSSRNVHVRPVPRLGGVAMVGGVLVPLVALLLSDSGVGALFASQHDLVVGLFAGGLAVAVLGLYDDLVGANARLKLVVQVAVALFLYALDFRIERVANPFGAELQLGALSLPLTVFWVVGVINALNLIDGLDGLAGGVAFIGVATNFALAAVRGDVVLCLLMATLAGAILGFLVFNFNPASIFMGDTGSMFLGFVLAAVSLKTSTKSGTAVAMLVPVMALGLPIMDTLLAILRRSLVGRPIFSADKEHIHHRLMSRLLLGQRGAVLVLYGLCGLFGLTALALNFANSAQSAMLLAAIALVVFLLMGRLGYLDVRRAGDVGVARRRNLQLRQRVRDAQQRLGEARSPTELWVAVRPLGEALGAGHLALSLEAGAASPEALVFQATRPTEVAGPQLLLRVEVRRADAVLGALELAWRDGRTQVDRDEELALELVADALAECAARLAPVVHHLPVAVAGAAARVLPLRRKGA